MNLCELTPPPVEHDRDVMKLESIITGLRSMRPHMKAIGDALAGTQAAGLAAIRSRSDALVSVAEFIGTASLLECKHIINELIDRTSTITGCATELENAACSLSRSIEIDGDVDGDASDSLRSYMEARDEA